MSGVDTILQREHDPLVLAFLITKPRPKLNARQRCQQADFACSRPMWGNGRVNGDFHGLCPLCWHAWNAWHGKYVTFRANPAALLDASNINRLRFVVEDELPATGIDFDTFPEEWAA